MNITKERIKTVLICILITGMLYLTYAVWFFDSPFGTIDIYGLFNSEKSTEFLVGEGSDLDVFGIRPMAVFIRDEEKSTGTVYETAISDEAYKKLREVTARVFATVKSHQTVSEAEWETALLGKGVFFDYFGDVPLGAIQLWLGSSNDTNELSGRYFMLSADKKNVEVFVKNSMSHEVYRLSCALSSQKLAEAVMETSAAPASLALEMQEDDFMSVWPETVIVSGRAKPVAISSYNSHSVYGEDIENTCLDCFRLRDVAPSTYSEADGTMVYVADMVTLKISPDGTVSYSDTRDRTDSTLGIGIDYDGEAPTVAEKTEAGRALVASVASRIPGDGGIYLMDVSEKADGTEIVFGRHVSGIPVDMQTTTYFARVIVGNESIRAAKINVRGYEATSQSVDVMSERLAAAAVTGSGMKGNLMLRYADDGSASIVPAWYIGGMQKKEEADELVES